MFIKVIITYIDNNDFGMEYIGAVWGEFDSKEEAINKWLEGIKNPEGIAIKETRIVENERADIYE